jgi:preprotein translocase subunit SecB
LQCHFEAISINAVPEFDASQWVPGVVGDPRQLALSSEVAVTDLEQSEDWSDYALRFVLSFSAKEAHAIPYQGELAAQAMVRMHGGSTALERKQQAVVNGVSLVYGVVRDMVCTLTARSQHGQMLLPTLNFRALADSIAVDETSAISPAEA